jgi:probable phosphoglycerate mutase
MTELYLIRHGEAVANVEPIVAGMRGDAGLTPLGVAQAEALRDRLAATGEIAPDVLISSTLPRARQTAEIIAPALGLPIIFDDDVQEMRVGEADGMTVGELKARYGLPDFRSEPFRPIAPGGEYWSQFVMRVAVTLDRITREHEDKTIVVVCHGGIIDASIIANFDLPLLVPPHARMDTHNTSITHWRRALNDADGALVWTLVGYNDTIHLHLVGRNEQISWGKVPPANLDEEEHPAVPLPMDAE